MSPSTPPRVSRVVGWLLVAAGLALAGVWFFEAHVSNWVASSRTDELL